MKDKKEYVLTSTASRSSLVSTWERRPTCGLQPPRRTQHAPQRQWPKVSL